jgi:hypothetical protein
MCTPNWVHLFTHLILWLTHKNVYTYYYGMYKFQFFNIISMDKIET